ncbi:hypothetical protein CMV_029722 [Castanea mollissima]|uniref:Transmembrane protein n=1 Tax=Castanea mollissima TaxID=60419 RepID=A0A8J4Q4M9_9ROSI|nr:hypothetical protein CMV_029722 [Castanea mollissima]
MFLAEIHTAGIISAYFFWHITSGYSLNVSDLVEVQPVQLSYGLCVFGCGLVFWLLVLLWAKLHEVAKLANLITPITSLNLYCCLLEPFVKFPLLVRFLVLFQASSNLALLLIWAFLSLKEYMKSSLTLNVCSVSCFTEEMEQSKRESLLKKLLKSEFLPNVEKKKIAKVGGQPRLFVRGTVDEAGGSGSGHGSGASGREENRGRYGGNDGGGGGGAGGGGESGSGHGSGASGSGENRGGSEGGDRGRDGGGADPESGRRVTNTEQAFKSSKITELSIMLTATTTAALVGFHQTPPSSSSKAMLVVVLIDHLVAYLCGLTSILLSSNPEDSEAAKIFGDIAFVCTALGFILTVAMFVAWYLVLIPVLLFGVVWLIFFRNGLKTRATEESSESLGHLFWSCQRARSMWGCSGLFGKQLDVHFSSFLDVLWNMLMIQNCKEEKLCLAVTLVGCLWNNRNEYRHGGKKKGEWERVQWAKNYLVEYQVANISTPMPP